MASSYGKRLVLATVGSLGDLFPFVALALELKARGHRPLVASHASFRDKVESAGVEFLPLRPDFAPAVDDPRAVQPLTNLRNGSLLYLIHNVLPYVRETYEDLLHACQGADMLISFPRVYVAPTVAEKLRLRHVVTLSAPSAIWSIYDPPTLSGQPILTRLCRRSPLIAALALSYGRFSTKGLLNPLDELRESLGLPPAKTSHAFEGRFSPHLNLALFSPLLAKPQRDWPANTLVTGSILYDGSKDGDRLAPEIEAYLASGPPPVVFTVGTWAWTVARDFFSESVAAAIALGYRAVLLIGPDPRLRPPAPLPPEILCAAYAPHSKLFPYAAAIVHHGGLGTLGQALRAGRPMLVVPFSLDQPNNARLATRLGVARTVPRTRYTADLAARELRELMDNPAYAARAAEAARQVQGEDGVTTACDAIEQCLSR